MVLQLQRGGSKWQTQNPVSYFYHFIRTHCLETINCLMKYGDIAFADGSQGLYLRIASCRASKAPPRKAPLRKTISIRKTGDIRRPRRWKGNHHRSFAGGLCRQNLTASENLTATFQLIRGCTHEEWGRYSFSGAVYSTGNSIQKPTSNTPCRKDNQK